MKTLEQRYHDAINALGGALGILKLPEEVRTALQSYVTLETKVKMLELVVEAKTAERRA